MRTQRKVLQDSKLKSILTPPTSNPRFWPWVWLHRRARRGGGWGAHSSQVVWTSWEKGFLSTPSLFSATSSSTAMSLTQTSSNLLSQSIMWRAQQYWWALQKYSDISWLTSVKAQRHEESSENILLQKGELVIKQNSPQVCTSMAAPWNVMAQLEKWLGVLQVVGKSKI